MTWCRRVALWLNLVPDLVHSGTLEKEQPPMEHYLTYQETLPFIPSIKVHPVSEKIGNEVFKF